MSYAVLFADKLKISNEQSKGGTGFPCIVTGLKHLISLHTYIYIYEELKMMLTLPPKYIGSSEFWFFEADRFKMNGSSYWFLEYIEVDILIEKYKWMVTNMRQSLVWYPCLAYY